MSGIRKRRLLAVLLCMTLAAAIPGSAMAKAKPAADTYTKSEEKDTKSEEKDTKEKDDGKSADEKIEERAQEILDDMSLKKKVGQMFLAEVNPSNAKKQIKKYHYGGLLLLKDSFADRSKKKVKKQIASWQKKASVKMLTAVDEEGGTVLRVSRYKKLRKKPFASPQDVYKKDGWKGIKKDAKEKAKFLKSLGINTNLAPVADTPASEKSYIYKRAFSKNANDNARFVKTVVKEFEKQDVVSTLKHFPGYGGNADTHTSIVYENRKLKKLEKKDLIPFQEGIDAGVPMVMVKHTVVKCMDKKWPASLSKKAHKYLRDKMGFDGVIVTDSLSMEAPQKWVGDDGEVAVQAVLAGNDLLCTNDAPDEFDAVYEAVKDGRIKESRIDKSVLRILKMKLKKGIIS